jgi:hypothetical protein
MTMCNCYTEITETLLDHVRKNAPEGSEKFDVRLEGYLFGVKDDGGMTHRSSNNVKGSYMAPKKSGGMKRVPVNTFVRASFCPFCGVKYT